MLGHLADLTEFWLNNSQFCSNIFFGLGGSYMYIRRDRVQGQTLGHRSPVRCCSLVCMMCLYKQGYDRTVRPTKQQFVRSFLWNGRKLTDDRLLFCTLQSTLNCYL